MISSLPVSERTRSILRSTIAVLAGELIEGPGSADTATHSAAIHRD